LTTSTGKGLISVADLQASILLAARVDGQKHAQHVREQAAVLVPVTVQIRVHGLLVWLFLYTGNIDWVECHRLCIAKDYL
jgi:hypothetical protein